MAGTNSTTVNVTVNGDTAVESGETFFVNLSAPVNATINDGTGQGTILNDDSATISINDPASINEGNSGVQSITFTVTLGQSDPNFPITVNYLISGGNEDGVSNTLTFPANTSTLSQTVDVTTNGDTILEEDEAITVSLSNPSSNANLAADFIGTSSFLNDDSATVTIADVSGDEDGGLITVTATLNNAVNGGFSVDVTTSDGTATVANSDYTPIVSQTLNFTGTTNETRTFTIAPTPDVVIEVDETVNVSMNNYIGPAGVSITDTAVVTLLNDDTAAISIDDPASIPEGNSGVQTIDFTVSIGQADPNNDITVQYTISGGNENGTGDTLTFLAGTSTLSQTISVTTNGDTDVEADEPISVTLSSPSTNGTIIKALGSSSFTNDDSSTISINDPTSVFEGDTGTATITFLVTLGQSDPNNDITVDYLISGGNQNGTGSTLTFAAGTTTLTQPIAVTTDGDVIVQADLAVSVTLSDPSANATIGKAVGSSFFEDDDDAGFTVTPLSLATAEGGVTQTFSVVLNNAPATNVILTIISNDTSEGTVSPASLTFTTGNYNVPRTITVTPVNDPIVDGDQLYNITVSVDDINSNDFFDVLADQNVVVTNSDDDAVGIFVSAISGNTTEDGVSATFTIFLESEPTADVTIPLSSSDLGRRYTWGNQVLF